MYGSYLSLAALVALASAQRPANTSVCDYYTTALFKDNTAANQLALVTAVVNRAGAGNKTSNPVVTGIVNPGMYNGKPVDISVYFTGALNSTNRGGANGVSVNFLDGGSANPPPATSNQGILFTHLYEYFGAVLGCSTYGKTGYEKYSGAASMYEVHKFMNLDEDEVGYFNTQVGLSAASFGVTNEDVTMIGTALNTLFNVRCAPNTTVIPEQGPQQQSICIAESCPLAVNSTCAAYKAQPIPVNATMANGGAAAGAGKNGTMAGGASGGSSPGMSAGGAGGAGGASATTSGRPAAFTGGAAGLTVGGVLGAAALALAL